jgi:hypothetical protein
VFQDSTLFIHGLVATAKCNCLNSRFKQKDFSEMVRFSFQNELFCELFLYPLGYTQLDDRRILMETNESFVNMKFMLQGSAIDIRWQPGGLLRMGGKHFQPFS